ncbi:F-box/LRR-repeat protein 12-like [Rutidosis leptorrhynchoides]|uniref:F-box/LRR-repeat protein 12-like n=1 Tax=Rutidosis leptorrhynchoides TaxID=125765 RepID=UPI003A9A533A
MGRHSRSLRLCTRRHLFELELLDYDSWYYIFQKLNSIIDQDSFGLTCSTFRRIQNSTSRKSLKIRCSIGHTIVDSFIINKLLSRHATKLETLTLGGCVRGCQHITYSCLTPLLKYGSTLHSLYLDHCGSITDTELQLVASACRLLSVISLAYTRISDDGLKVLSKSCKFLEELNLRACDYISDHGIFYLNQNCRQLRALRIRGCYNIGGAGFRDCSPTLACLEAFDIQLEPYMGVSHIVSGGGLEYLSLGLSFFNGNRLSTNFLLDPIGLGFGSKLKYLNISASRVDDGVILKISRGCPLLQEWNLTFCGGIEISGWESIGLYCQNLETLHVAGCDIHLCEKGLVSIGAGCKRLSLLFIDEEFSWNDDLTSLQRQGVEIKFQESWNDVPSWAFKTLENERGH